MNAKINNVTHCQKGLVKFESETLLQSGYGKVWMSEAPGEPAPVPEPDPAVGVTEPGSLDAGTAAPEVVAPAVDPEAEANAAKAATETKAKDWLKKADGSGLTLDGIEMKEIKVTPEETTPPATNAPIQSVEFTSKGVKFTIDKTMLESTETTAKAKLENINKLLKHLNSDAMKDVKFTTDSVVSGETAKLVIELDQGEDEDKPIVDSITIEFTLTDGKLKGEVVVGIDDKSGLPNDAQKKAIAEMFKDKTIETFTDADLEAVSGLFVDTLDDMLKTLDALPAQELLAGQNLKIDHDGDKGTDVKVYTIKSVTESGGKKTIIMEDGTTVEMSKIGNGYQVDLKEKDETDKKGEVITLRFNSKFEPAGFDKDGIKYNAKGELIVDAEKNEIVDQAKGLLGELGGYLIQFKAILDMIFDYVGPDATEGSGKIAYLTLRKGLGFDNKTRLEEVSFVDLIACGYDEKNAPYTQPKRLSMLKEKRFNVEDGRAEGLLELLTMFNPTKAGIAVHTTSAENATDNPSASEVISLFLNNRGNYDTKAMAKPPVPQEKEEATTSTETISK